ncbi:MAG: hypothetical protein IIC99_07680 [Chloroflexi bacterium]|nr:hypothetical protein [Chloroflexota bacterium]
MNERAEKSETRPVWPFIIGVVAVIVMGIFTTQAFSASITVNPDPLQNAGGDLTFSSDWSSASSIVTRHERSAASLNVSDQFTGVTVDGTKAAGGSDVTVQLLDASAAIMDTGTASLDSGSGSYSQLVTLTGGNIAYYDVVKVLASYVLTGGVAIVFDAVSSANGKSSALTWSHTVGAGDDRILVVGVSLKANNVVSGVTYGGQALTLVPGSVASHANGDRVELWYKVAPLTGANNVVVSLPSSVQTVAGATSWTGVHQSTPLGTAVPGTGTSATASVDVGSIVGDVVVDAVSTAGSVTVGANQTQQWNLAQAGFKGGGSSEDGADTTTTMSWTFTSGDWAISGVALKQANP